MAKCKKMRKREEKIIVSDAIKWPSGKISGGTDLMVIKKYKYKEDNCGRK